jgi:anti-anti-sigma regulatory factor
MRDDALPPRAPAPGALAIHPLHGRTGLRLAGEADCAARDRLHAALAALPADRAGDIHLDLTGLRFIDLCCTRELVAITERHPGVRIIVYRPPATLRRIIALLYPEARIEFVEASVPGAGEGVRHGGLAQRGTAAAAAGKRPAQTL